MALPAGWRKTKEISSPKKMENAKVENTVAVWHGNNQTRSRMATVKIMGYKGGPYEVRWSQGRGQGGGLGTFSSREKARKRAVKWINNHKNI